MGKAPEKLKDGRSLMYDELVISKKIMKDILMAVEFLDLIKKPYKPQDGWVELESSIQKVNGGYAVWMHQALYA